MVTNLAFLAKQKNTNLYCGVFIGGKGAWCDLYELYKRASSIEEAKKWANNLVISHKWNLQEKWFRDLDILEEPTLAPYCAGQDEILALDNNYIIENGFELTFSCNRENHKGCYVEWNEGSRKKPVFQGAFIRISPIRRILVQHRAGRSGCETLHLESIKRDWEIVEWGTEAQKVYSKA